MQAMRSPQRPGGGQPRTMAPADFNRVARLQRSQVGNIAYLANANNQYYDLPPVGYHYRTFLNTSLALVTAGSVTGRFLGGFVGATTGRFMAPWGLVRSLSYALNVSSPIYKTDGFGNWLVQLYQNQGANPFVQAATADAGFGAKEINNCLIYNVTDSAIVKPDAVTVASKTYALKMSMMMPMTFGEAATMGLVPVQDIRIRPQVSLDFGGLADLLSVVGDASSGPSGNFEIVQDYFTVPNDTIRPDTSFVCQTRMDTQGIASVGENIYRPQIGGVILRVINSWWNGSKAIAPSIINKFRLRVQQGLVLEDRAPNTFIADEGRWYNKRMPDGVYTWDFTTGFGDPTIVSLRDRIASNDFTALDFIGEIAAGTSLSATSELRSYLQQMVPLPSIGR